MLLNQQIAELLAREAERTTFPAQWALRRAARRAYVWEYEATYLIHEKRSLTELSGVGPFIEKLMEGWIARPPGDTKSPPIRAGFLDLGAGHSCFAEKSAIRWLGDRKNIEEQTTTWDKAIVDSTTELTSWVDFCYQIMKRGVLVYGYANNHYAGHAPATIEQFRNLWSGKGFPLIEMPPRLRQKSSLFD